MIAYRFFLLPALLFIQTALISQAIPPLEEPSLLKEASWGFVLLDAQGRQLAGHNAERMLATASVMKAVTAATALDKLGTEFRYETRLGYRGAIVQGKLEGDLLVKGAGDPSLGSDRFPDEAFLANWAESLKARGLSKVEGDIIADVSAWSSQLSPDGWPWQDMGNYYGAGASALNFQENMYSLYLKAGPRVGAEVSLLRTFPEMPEMAFRNELKTGPRGSGDQAYIYGSHYSQLRYLRGTIPLGANGFRIKGSMNDPALYCVRALKEALESCGILVEGEARFAFQSSAGFNLMDKKSSPPLTELIHEMNMNSINLYAECLLKTASGKTSTADAADWLEKHWEGKGVSGAMRFSDGSGLSSDNAASPLAIAQVLRYASLQPWAGDFKGSLPVAGQSGSLESRFRGTAGQGRIFAKTGTTGHVRSLAGFIHTQSGKKYTFCLLINHYKGSGSAVSRALDGWLARVAAG
ncbi:MAG: D-alanyl-D-alanine carboxypeptidase/D-alanyl-D-alanine-endopeptidase [Bacteroidia bacterium]